MALNIIIFIDGKKMHKLQDLGILNYDKLGKL